MKTLVKITFIVSGFYLSACSGNATDKINEENALSKSDRTEESAQRTPVQQQTNKSEQSTNANVAVNPPHGQPGHDCAIPVGAPLNSDAAEAVPAQKNTPTNSENTPKIGVAEGLNPPHGQPGHDCAIPVGAPLNK